MYPCHFLTATLILMGSTFLSVTASALTPDECRKHCAESIDSGWCIKWGQAVTPMILPYQNILDAVQAPMDGEIGEVCGQKITLNSNQITITGAPCVDTLDRPALSFFSKSKFDGQTTGEVTTSVDGTKEVHFTSGFPYFRFIHGIDAGEFVNFIAVGKTSDGHPATIWATKDYCFSGSRR